MRGWPLLSFVLTGCGLAEGGILVGTNDANVGPDTSTDAPLPQDASLDQVGPDVQPGNCDPNKPFGSAVGVVEINGAGQNESLRTFSGGLNAVFASNRAGTLGGFDLYFTSRASLTSPYAGPVNGGALINTAFDDRTPTITDDGLTLYFARTVGLAQIYQAKRTAITDPFGIAAAVPFISIGSNDLSPFVSGDGERLYFASDRSPRVGATDIFRADLGSNGFFQTPVRLPELSFANAQAVAPVLTADELTMYFASDRPNMMAKGNLDVWRSKRLTKNDPWGAPTPVPEVSTGALDAPSSISADGCTLIVTSDRAGGQLEVYSATRPK